MDITIRQDDNFVYADVFDAPPASELNIEIRSKAVEPNTSTEGVTAGLHRTVSADGTTHFRVPRDYMLPDFPREVTAIGPISSETFTA